MPFHMTGQLSLWYDGVMNVTEEGNSFRAGGYVGGGAAVFLNGGLLSIDSDGLSRSAELAMLELADQAFVSITGGRYEVVEDGVNVTPLIIVGGEGELRIKGFDLNRPYGVVPDDAGTVFGRLADGQAFHFDFMKLSGRRASSWFPNPARWPSRRRALWESSPAFVVASFTLSLLQPAAVGLLRESSFVGR